ncbi:CSL-type zinc finger protein-containing protein, putative [Monoraphidium neglectum]|uniref:CSL-type zinc finger protein-containing protein, putative n=1 Tax=Monoraphidium neglectum TaxID=145388 RepID=A0A0D2MR71_9CHLO|nr:CSL-type zinc finger protein-containing protein, putative [Monoraphidium neglectum]KIZ05095.1 CSL-type zinc finger protein-containing protein, putative [Monoraphidium neglectum]|eukprot:XP_013904114.1 CSL-type zinc finger protein-containing protein, putative [Monoraphidium neglectum]
MHPLLLCVAPSKTLRDPQRRARYDRILTQRELRSVVTLQDEIDLDEMHAEEEPQGGGKVYTYVCRCGDVYALNPDDDELCELEAVVVPCSSCSNHILVRLHRQPPGVD